MSRRLLSRRWLVFLVVAWAVALAAVPRVGEAAPLPPARDGVPDGDLDAVRSALESKLAGQQLLALGLSPADVNAALARLTPTERAELLARAHELTSGGNGVELLAFAIVVALLVILILELLGRRVISRP